MENSKVLVLIGITLIIWCALYRYRTTTAKWVFIAASLSTCLAFVLGLSGFLGLGHGYIDLLSLVNVFLCQMRVFGTGVLGTRYCRVPGSWYRAEGYVGPGR